MLFDMQYLQLSPCLGLALFSAFCSAIPKPQLPDGYTLTSSIGSAGATYREIEILTAAPTATSSSYSAIYVRCLAQKGGFEILTCD